MSADRYTARLTECYDEQALHFSHTRKKHRPEISYIHDFITHYRTQKQPSSSPTLLEVGCGAGRGYEALRDVLPEDISYTGIDIAPGMIRLAKKSFATAQRKVAEMQSYLKNMQPETLDMLIGIASVQHLFSAKERSLFFAHAYQALQRGGVMILVDRSCSEWFLKKYRRTILKNSRRYLVSGWKRNDLMIPWKDPGHAKNKKTYQRYYHLFTLHELRQLAFHHGFVLRELTYIGQDGLPTNDWRDSRNSVLIVEKALH